MNIFIGNLSFDATDADVYKIFIKFGAVSFISIVKEKKGIKSRGFGFVEMPDEEQAKAAITALNGTEFMGRELNVSVATSKAGAPGTRKKSQLRSEGYKSGRRTRSFMRRATEESPEERLTPWKSKSWRKDQVQSKPWRRIGGQPKPWQTTDSQSKPWQRTEESNSWRKDKIQPKLWSKSEGQSKPWRKSEGQPKPWQRVEGKPKPWRKTEGQSKPWKKTEDQSKPWKRTEGESKPWKKTEGQSKPWQKTEKVVKEYSRPPWKSKSKKGGYKR